MFLIHKLVDDPFSIFSKYTPEKPDVHAAQRIATRPSVRFWFSTTEFELVLDVLPEV